MSGKITVVSGVNELEIKVKSGQTVQDIKSQLSDVFNLPSDVIVKHNGNEISLGSQAPSEGVLEFVKKSGTKG